MFDKGRNPNVLYNLKNTKKIEDSNSIMMLIYPNHRISYTFLLVFMIRSDDSQV